MNKIKFLIVFSVLSFSTSVLAQEKGISTHMCGVEKGYEINLINPNDADINAVSFAQKPEGVIFVTWATVHKVRVNCTNKGVNITALEPAKIVVSDEMLGF
jgi:hypothetical protein